METTLQCPSAEQWQRIQEWDFADADPEQFASHLEECAACAARVEGLTKRSFGRVMLASDDIDETLDPAHLERLVSRFLPPRQPLPETTDRPPPAGSSASWSVSSDAESPELDDPAATKPAMAIAPEHLQLGPFRMTRLIAGGGMGVVYEAWDRQLERRVAVKVMRPDLAGDDNARQRFFQEGKTLAAVNSEHVVKIHHVDWEGKVPYLAMEYLDGCDLENSLASRTEPITAADILHVAQDALSGLVAAHAAGLIHRDIKPTNLWVVQGNGRVKLLDFGLTRRLEGGGMLTRRNAILGTPAFMSPEQACGEAVDARTDLFSLGVVLYRMAAGSSPFHRDPTMSTLGAIVSFDPPPLTNLPQEVSGFIARLMSKDRGARPKDAATALAELQAIERRRLHPPAPRRRKRVAEALAAVAIIIAATVIIIIRDSNGRPIAKFVIPGDAAKGGKAEIIDPKTGKIVTVPFGPENASSKKAQAENSTIKEIAVGARVAVVPTADADSVFAYADKSGGQPHELRGTLATGTRGEVLAIDKENGRCRLHLEDTTINDIWLSLDHIEQAK